MSNETTMDRQKLPRTSLLDFDDKRSISASDRMFKPKLDPTPKRQKETSGKQQEQRLLDVRAYPFLTCLYHAEARGGDSER